MVVNKGGGQRDVAPGERSNVEHVMMPVRPMNLKGKKWSPHVRLDEDDGWSGSGSDEEGEKMKQEDTGAGEVGIRVGNFRPHDYELGEYGFPDDGYDYKQHFVPMGGGQYLAAAKMADAAMGNLHFATLDILLLLPLLTLSLSY